MSNATPETTLQSGKKNSSKLKKIFVVIVIVFLGLQLYPVDRFNPEVLGDIPAPDDVKAILKRACYDCHSNETKWLWYSYIAPASILISSDVKEGREHLNFSNWIDEYGDEEDTPDMFLDVCWEEIASGEMPLWFYKPLHPEANLSQEDLSVLKKWCGADQSDDDSKSGDEQEEG